MRPSARPIVREAVGQFRFGEPPRRSGRSGAVRPRRSRSTAGVRRAVATRLDFPFARLPHPRKKVAEPGGRAADGRGERLGAGHAGPGLPVCRKRRVDGPRHAEGVELRHRPAAPRLLEDQADLPSHPVPGHAREGSQCRRRGDRRARHRVDSKPQPICVAHRAKSARRIVEKGAGMQLADDTALEILRAAEGVDAAAPGPEADGHRVDREVPAGEVLPDGGARDDGGKRPRVRVGLAARGRDVDLLTVAKRQRARAESSMLADRSGEPRRDLPGKRDPVALDHQVDVAHRAPEVQIAHDAAGQVEADAAFARQLRGRSHGGPQPGRQPRRRSRRRTRRTPPPPAPGSRSSAEQRGRSASNRRP